MCILLAKAVDGVYDSDPKTNPQAVRSIDKISIQEVIDRKLAVVDLTASILCMENHMPMLCLWAAGGKQHYPRSQRRF